MADSKAAWTVMVYLAGDNNLTTECMFALTEMKLADFGQQINVIAQFDPSDPYLPTHRYHIQRCGKKKSFHHDIIDRACYVTDKGEVKFARESECAEKLATLRAQMGDYRTPAWNDANLTGSAEEEAVITDDTDSGSPITLYNFISFCIENYEAEHYLVVLSGHAGGTERDYLMRDESSSGSLTFNELKKVFQRVRDDLQRPIDIIGMDNCLMSMAEISYELRGLAQIVVGCESFSPASGWPYREVLERLAKDFVTPCLQPGESAVEAAARAIVKEYVNYYANYWMAGLSVTQSALNISKVEKLHELIETLAQLMEQHLVAELIDEQSSDTSTGRPFQDALLLAHWEAQSYNGEQFVDLYDLCDCLQARIGDGRLATQCEAVKQFIASEFVLRSCYSGPAYQYSYGVSLYFPWSHVAPSYWNLDFVKHSKGMGWGNFLKTYTLLTRRMPRGIDPESRLATALGGTIEDVMLSVTHRMATDRMATDRMATDRMATDRMATDRMATDRMNSARNYIHSMRNPPDTFFPDACIRKRHSCLTTQEMLRLR
jgi:cysteine peptidase C11 family protein